MPIEGYVADVYGDDDVLYEIQTAGFGSLKQKLTRLLESYKVVLVYPIAETRYIVKLSEDELATKRRKSPKRGAISHVLDELVSIPTLLNHPNFELEVVLIEEEEFRVHDPARDTAVVARAEGAVEMARSQLGPDRDTSFMPTSVRRRYFEVRARSLATPVFQ